jgi:DNA-binding response OmpR family regulator
MVVRIAVVDDDAPINDAYRAWIQGEFPIAQVTPFRTFAEATAGLAALPFDLVILDINLGPTMQERIGGFSLAQLLRDRDIPVVIVSGSSHRELYKPIMAHLFTWDYIEKPVDQVELISKVHQILSTNAKKARGEKDLTHATNLVIDPYARQRVVWKGHYVPASDTHVKILKYLVERAGRIVGYDELQRICPSSQAKQAVRNHIKEIRENFESVDETFDQIETITMKGYMWKSDPL